MSGQIAQALRPDPLDRSADVDSRTGLPAHTLRGLADRLAPGGRLLVVMLPAGIQYLLFEAALARFEELQPDPAVIEGHVRAAGLEAGLSYVEHELRIGRER
ncbi:hypothetical protein [Streptomyces sp. NPDC002573]|uniref:hypothetical protein n=1 Tax=Streptomyces sp. NPDC002573 TaxID=3364651 RepID=UPI0036D0F059